MPISPDLKRKVVIANGFNPDQFTTDDDGENIIQIDPQQQYQSTHDIQPSVGPQSLTPKVEPTPTNTPLQTGLKSFGQSVFPALASGAGAAIASQFNPLAHVAPPWSELGSLGMGIGGAILGGMAGGKVQEMVEPQAWQQDAAQAQAENPKSAIVGSIAALPFGGFNPNPANVVRAGGALAKIAGGLSPEAGELGHLVNVGLGAGIGGGQSIGSDIINNRPIDPLAALREAATGALFNSPNALGRNVFRFHGVNNEGGSPGVNDLEQPKNDQQQQTAKVNPTPDANFIRDINVRAGQKPKFNKKGELVWENKIYPLTDAGLAQFNKDYYGDEAMVPPTPDTTENQIAQMEGEGGVTGSVKEELGSLKDDIQRRDDFQKAKQELEAEKLRLKVEELKAKLAAEQIGSDEKRTTPLATTELGKEIMPDFTGNTEHDNTVNASEDDLAQRRLEGYEDRYSDDSDLKARTPYQIEMLNALKGKPTNPTLNWFKKFIEWGATFKGIKIDANGIPFHEKTGEPVAGQTILKEGIPQLIKLNLLGDKNLAGPDTTPHELTHATLAMLRKSGRPKDAKLVSDYENIVANSKDYLEWKSKRDAADKSSTPEEYIATNGGYQYLETAFNLKGEKGYQKWLNDYKSYLKTRFGKHADEADFRRLLDYKLRNDRTKLSDLNIENPNATTASVNSDKSDLNERANEAAHTQRGIPETQMLRSVDTLAKAGHSGNISYFLEHLGDLSHRAQERGGIGMMGFKEKIRKLERYLYPPKGYMDLQQELANDKLSNAIYSVVKKHPEIQDDESAFSTWEVAKKKYPEEIAAAHENITKVEQKALSDYIKAHEEHNQPITKLGLLGKKAAIAFAKNDMFSLKSAYLDIKDHLTRMDKAKTHEEAERIRLEQPDETTLNSDQSDLSGDKRRIELSSFQDSENRPDEQWVSIKHLSKIKPNIDPSILNTENDRTSLNADESDLKPLHGYRKYLNEVKGKDLSSNEPIPVAQHAPYDLSLHGDYAARDPKTGEPLTPFEDVKKFVRDNNRYPTNEELTNNLGYKEGTDEHKFLMGSDFLKLREWHNNQLGANEAMEIYNKAYKSGRLDEDYYPLMKEHLANKLLHKLWTRGVFKNVSPNIEGYSGNKDAIAGYFDERTNLAHARPNYKSTAFHEVLHQFFSNNKQLIYGMLRGQRDKKEFNTNLKEAAMALKDHNDELYGHHVENYIEHTKPHSSISHAADIIDELLATHSSYKKERINKLGEYFSNLIFGKDINKLTRRYPGQNSPAAFNPGWDSRTQRFYSEQTELPEFKKWFGDSKVVDENGKPLVVYHGTKFDPNEFKTNPEQIKSAIGNRGTFDPNDPDIRHSDSSDLPLNNRLDDIVGASKESKEALPFSSLPLFRSQVDDIRRIKTGKNENNILADAITNFYNDKESIYGKGMSDIIAKASKMKQSDIDHVESTLIKEYRDKSDHTNELTSEAQKELHKAVRNSLNQKQQDQINANQPVRDYVTDTYRLPKIDPFYYPNRVNPAVIEVLHEKGNSVAAKKLKQDFLDHQIKAGIRPEMANEALDNILTGYDKGSTNLTRFNANRKSEGVGLPDSWMRYGLMKNLSGYYNRVSADRAYHDNIESKPDIAKVAGIKKDAWGKDITSDKESLEGNPVVAHALEKIQGEPFDKTERGIRVLNRLATSMMLGPLTNIHIGASSVFNSQQHTTPLNGIHAAVKALTSLGESYQHAIETGYIRKDFSKISDILDRSNSWIDNINHLANMISKSSGRDLTNNFTKSYLQGFGEVIIPTKIEAAKKGDKGAIDLMQRIDPSFDANKNYSNKEIITLASRFAGLVHGSHDSRTMPSWMLKETAIQPFLQLASWNIAQTNQWMRHVWTPAVKHGNYAPLLISTLGAGLGGYVIKELREMLSDKDGAIPSLAELANSSRGLEGNIPSIAYNYMACASYTGYAGVLSVLGKAIFDGAHKNIPQGATFPLDEMLSNPAHRITQFVSALATDKNMDYPSAAARLLKDLVADNYQMGRLATTWAAKAGVFPDIEQQHQVNEKNNMLRRFEMAEGYPYDEQAPLSNNPYLNSATKKFKHTQDLGEAASQVPQLIENALKEANGNPDILKEALHRMKATSYQTMPSPERLPYEFYKYMTWLSNTKGPEKASEVLMDYMKVNAINKVKESMIPSMM